MIKDITIEERKLGRENAYGQAWEHFIELDSRLVGKKRMEILIHEILHHQNPDMSETQVLKRSKQLTKILWKQKYRRIDDIEKQPITK